jgi:DNA-binding response OmpR family regulator
LNGRTLELTRREFDLLAFLASHPGRVYSRQDLLDRVWGLDFMGGERTVDQHITQLRAHLDDDPIEPHFIETVRGKGYRMRASGEDEPRIPDRGTP